MQQKYFLILFAFIFGFANHSFSQNALSLDGINDYVSTSQGGPGGASSRTVEAWIRTSYSGATQGVLVDWGSVSANGNRFTLNVQNGLLRVEIGGSGFSSTTNVADGAWHHVAVTYNNSNASGLKAKLYIDGALDASADFTVTINTLTTTGIRIGARVDGVSFFTGSIDEVRVWNIERTAAQILANKNTEFCSVPSGLVAYFKCNQGIASGANTSISNLTNTANATYNGTFNGLALTGNSSNFVAGSTVTTLSILSKKDSFNCGPGTVTLGATTSAGASLKWYNTATGGTSIGNGNTFVTPSLSTTTNFYVEAVQASLTGQAGRNDYTGISQATPNNTGQGIQFNALTNFNLDSVSVWVTTDTGKVIVQLQNASNTVLQTNTFTFSGTGATATSRVKIYLPVNYSITTGNNYKILALNGTTVPLSREGSIAPPFSTYSISNVVTMVSSWVNGAQGTTNYYYFYNLYVSAGCASPRQAVTASIRPKPIINLGNDTTICPGVSYTFNAGNPGSTYLWSTGETTQTITKNAAAAYSVTVRANTCVNWDTILITPGITPVNIMVDSTNLCDGNIMVLNAGNAGCTYSWIPGGANTQSISVNTENNYTVTIKSIDGCKIDGSTFIKIRPLPIANLGNDTAICSTQSILLDAGNPGYSYTWNTGAATQTINSADSGTYKVTITTPFNCVLNDSIHIAYLPSPRTEGFNFIPRFFEELGKVEFAPLNPTNVMTYEWDFGDGSPLVTIINPIHVYTASGEYEVTLKVYNDCSDYTVQQKIHVDLPTGIVTLSGNDIHLLIYPNPAKSILNISNNNPDYVMEDVMVFNAVGSMVYHQKADSKMAHQLSVEGFPSGVYFLRILTDKGFVNKQIQVLK